MPTSHEAFSSLNFLYSISSWEQALGIASKRLKGINAAESRRLTVIFDIYIVRHATAGPVGIVTYHDVAAYLKI